METAPPPSPTHIFGCCILFCTLHFKKHIEVLDCGQQTARRPLKGLENMSYEEELRDLGLFIPKRSLRGPVSLSQLPGNRFLGPVYSACSTWTRGSGLELRKGVFRLDTRKILCTVEVLRR